MSLDLPEHLLSNRLEWAVTTDRVSREEIEEKITKMMVPGLRFSQRTRLAFAQAGALEIVRGVYDPYMRVVIASSSKSPGSNAPGQEDSHFYLDVFGYAGPDV